MRQALSQLISDFLSAILFLAVYLIIGDITAAAALAVAAGLVQVGVLKINGWRVEPMQWIGLVLVFVLGGATMLTQSPHFVMLKPSIVHFAIAAAMLRRGWMRRYLPDFVRQNLPDGVPIAAGYAWAGLLTALGLVNLAIVAAGDLTLWAWFISVGAVGAKVLAFLLQVVVFRTLIRRRRNAVRAARPGGIAMAG